MGDVKKPEKIEEGILQLQEEVCRPFPLVRDNDTTIHWVLVAMNDFVKDLDKSGLFIDELDKAAENLYNNLDATIHCRVTDYTSQNYLEDDSKDPDFKVSTLVNDIMQAYFLDELNVYEANFLI